MKHNDPQKCEAKDTPEQLDLLTDHRKPVWELFDQFERLKDSSDERRKRDLAATICREIAESTRSSDVASE